MFTKVTGRTLPLWVILALGVGGTGCCQETLREACLENPPPSLSQEAGEKRGILLRYFKPSHGAAVRKDPDGSAKALVPLPRELHKVSLPPYQIEPPDVLLINAIRMVPRPPYRIESPDTLVIDVTPTLERRPISGLYVVEPEGTVNLGFSYGSVPVAGLTLKEAKAAIQKHLTATLKEPSVTVSLGQFGGIQQIRGEHLVRPDGTVGLGTYGSVYVAGLTLDEAKEAIEAHLSRFLLKPRIALDVSGYNSKVYYIVTDGGGDGELVVRVPVTGNETVLDALSQINGLPAVASKKHIWLARPAPAEEKGVQVLPVDYSAIVRGASTATNYQILPGDRVYVNSQFLVKSNNFIAKLAAPIERLLGVSLLGDTTAITLQNKHNGAFGGGIAR
jgi:protein involved in polysaccharide export with SLBB domain